MKSEEAGNGRPRVRVRMLAAFVFLLMWTEALAAQDPLAAARELYAAARYEDALDVLNGLKTDQRDLAAGDLRAVEQYRSFCLLALGRDDEADAAISAIVASDPLYEPDETEVSPRIRAAFREVRQRLLPELAAQQYADAKAAFDRKEYDHASQLFRRLLALLDRTELHGRLADLRTLGAGFLDLSIAAATPPAPPPPPPAPAEPRPPPPVYQAGDPGVIPPVPIEQELPKLAPHMAGRIRGAGVLEVLVDERGLVETAVVRRSVHAVYDPLVLNAARAWRYEPATLNGAPVKFRKVIPVRLADKD